MPTWNEAWEAVRNERHAAHDRKARRNEMELKEYLRFYQSCCDEQERLDDEKATTTPQDRRPQVS
jgi:hypothetical protein